MEREDVSLGLTLCEALYVIFLWRAQSDIPGLARGQNGAGARQPKVITGMDAMDGWMGTNK
jgi:hypothetical protein